MLSHARDEPGPRLPYPEHGGRRLRVKKLTLNQSHLPHDPSGDFHTTPAFFDATDDS